jgi:hypothetical protein
MLHNGVSYLFTLGAGDRKYNQSQMFCRVCLSPGDGGPFLGSSLTLRLGRLRSGQGSQQRRQQGNQVPWPPCLFLSAAWRRFPVS